MNTRKASEGKWLFKEGTFAKEISSFGDISSWEEVDETFKAEWEKDHPVDEPEL